MRTRRLFKSRETRDNVWRQEGMIGSRGSVNNQQLHPMYIEDWAGPEKNETGLGNPHYKMHHNKLYTLEA